MAVIEMTTVRAGGSLSGTSCFSDNGIAPNARSLTAPFRNPTAYGLFRPAPLGRTAKIAPVPPHDWTLHRTRSIIFIGRIRS